MYRGEAMLHSCHNDDAAALSELSQGNLCVRCPVKTNYLANAHFGVRGEGKDTALVCYGSRVGWIVSFVCGRGTWHVLKFI